MKSQSVEVEIAAFCADLC